MEKLPKYLQPKSIKTIANNREKKVYKHLLSGALSWSGDFSDSTSLIEHKGTEKKSISITTKICDKLIEQALEMGKENSVLIMELPDYYIIGKVIKK